MKIIVGIGNYGKVYHETRHNIGFMVLDRFCRKHNLEFHKSDRLFESAGGVLNASRFLFIKPLTYVNLSGRALDKVIQQNEIDAESELLVISDDLNLPLGKIRIREKGSDGGHHGLYSIISSLQNNHFPRIRVGIGQPSDSNETKDFVLSNFSDEEFEILNKSLEFCTELVECFIDGKYEAMLNYFSKNHSKLQ